MQACTSISRFSRLTLILLGLLWVWPGAIVQSYAQETPPVAKPQQPEEQEFSETPYTGYGEFNEQDDEDESSRFFQYGRFFGVSLGAGFNGVTGNRGVLYQGGLPAVDFKVMYWFDFNFALELGLTSVQHFYDSTVRGHADISLNRVGLDLRYYLPMEDLSAPITFANPYLVVGGGTISKTESLRDTGVVENDTGLGLTLGGGLEFTVSPRKAYLGLSARYHLVTFKDTYTSEFQGESIPVTDLTGGFYTVMGSVLFTW
jgi:hypothetical protein